MHGQQNIIKKNFIMFIIVLGPVEMPEDDSIRIETCCPNTIINTIKICCV